MKIAPVATAIDVDDALMADPTAAIAEPPQIAVPELTRSVCSRPMPSSRPSPKPTTNAPTMVAAASYSLWKNRHELVFDDIPLIAVGLVFAFLSALAVVRGLIAFVGRHGFRPFAWYRLILGLAILVALAFG